MVKFKYKDTEIKCINMVNSTLVVGINFKNVVDIDIIIENQPIEEKIIEDTKLQKEIYHQLEKEYQSTIKSALFFRADLHFPLKNVKITVKN